MGNSESASSSGVPGDCKWPCSACQSCAIRESGECGAEYAACTNAPYDECFQLEECIAACPDRQVDEQAYFDCLCTNELIHGQIACAEALNPPQMSKPGTCLGDYPAGGDPLLALWECMSNACWGACD